MGQRFPCSQQCCLAHGLAAAEDVARHGQSRGHSAALVTVSQGETVDVVPDAGQMQKELPTDEWQQEEEAFGLLTLWSTHL